MADAISGKISSEVSITTCPSIPSPITASGIIPSPVILQKEGNIFHPQLSHYKATYISSDNLNEKSIPGYFTGMGTDTVTFYFDPVHTVTKSGVNANVNLTGYNISCVFQFVKRRFYNRCPIIS